MPTGIGTCGIACGIACGFAMTRRTTRFTAGFTTVVRTLTATTASVLYTAAQQTTDFGASQSTGPTSQGKRKRVRFEAAAASTRKVALP